MLRRFFASSLILVAFVLQASAQEQPQWTKFSSAEGRFSILLPTEKPLREEQTKETSAGKVVMHFFTAGSEKGLFIIAYADYQMSAAKQELDANRDSFLRGMKATLVSESDIKLQDNPGREIRAERDRLSIRSRIYLVGKRYYQMIAITPATLPGNLEADRFLASFELQTARTASAAGR
jgi:hypothetical protein